MHPKFSGNMLPVAALVLAATGWGLVWVPIRYLEGLGLHGAQSSLLIYVTTFLVGAAGLALRRRWPGPLSWEIAFVALGSGWCNVAFIVALLEGSVVRVLLLFYLAPLWTVLLARFLLREPMTAGTWLTVLMAVSGAAVMLWDPTIGRPWPSGLADWLAVTAGFGFALSNVMVRRLTAVPVWDKCVVGWLGGATMSAAWLAVLQPAWPASPQAIGAGAAVGMFGILFLTSGVMYGVSRMAAHRSAVILLLELVVGALSAHLLAGEATRPAEWAGGALILLAAWVAAGRVPGDRASGKTRTKDGPPPDSAV